MSDDSTETETAEVDEVEQELGRAPQRRHDGLRAGAPKKAVEPKRRHDSEVETPIDGWGDPFQIECAPGFRAFFVSEFDVVRLWQRPWSMATWGDPRIKSYHGVNAGVDGTPLRFNELTVYVMKNEDWEKVQRRDAKRIRHNQLREVVQRRAEESGAVDAANPNIRIPNPSYGFMNHIAR